MKGHKTLGNDRKAAFRVPELCPGGQVDRPVLGSADELSLPPGRKPAKMAVPLPW